MRHPKLNAVIVGVAVSLGAASLFVAPLAEGATPAASTVVHWAEPAGSPPNYIFPFLPLEKYSVANINTFQYLMYRPLYWFGSSGTPNLNTGLSLAAPPVYSDGNKTVTITMKDTKWSNGESVSSQDVAFWFNLLHADKGWWAAYTPGAIPDTIRSVTTPSSSKLVITLSAAVNPQWFTANQLSQITPLPLAWDRTTSSGASGSGGCATATYGTQDPKCNAVFRFLSEQAGYHTDNPTLPNDKLSTYASNPLWQVVDGPWRLSSFDASGLASFVPNTSSPSGSKSKISQFVEVPFSSAGSELSALESGTIDVGYLPPQNVQTTTKNPFHPAQANKKLTKFTLAPLYSWSVNYLPYNFDTTAQQGATAKVFSQLYFRQAMQLLVNQDVYIRDIFHGFGVPSYGPTPIFPSASSTKGNSTKNPYPYNPKRAKELLASHGWKVRPSGTTICSNAGTGSSQCGAGIPKGTSLTFTLEYANDAPGLGVLMNALQASWAQAGIRVNLTSATSSQVLQTAVPCSPGQTCSWQLASWGTGWLYESSSYPTGEAPFFTGSSSNPGSYSSRKADGAIIATMTTKTSLKAYSALLSTQLPVIWQPNPAAVLTEYRSSLHGVTPQNPLFSLTPERWSY